jgi:hypothetical protein
MRRHPFHSLCPYFAMFPEQFVAEQLLKYTKLGDLVFDPFCGRGTTVFESLLQGRRAVGSDINSVAACIAGAKADAPTLEEALRRINELEVEYDPGLSWAAPSDFFLACYSEKTLPQILYLRDHLNWRESCVDRFIAAITLGAIHGESHRSDLYLSNRMPRTISTKPEYSIRWWNKRGLRPPDRDAFDILRRLAMFRYRIPPASMRGLVMQGDARHASERFQSIAGDVKLVVTSPPYLDTTDYAEDQWLRLWFLGGPMQPVARQHKDDRITHVPTYWRFLTEAWGGMRGLLADRAVIVVRIGGSRLSKEELLEGLAHSLTKGLRAFEAKTLSSGITSSIRPRETSAFRRTSARERVEHDFTFQLSRC